MIRTLNNSHNQLTESYLDCDHLNNAYIIHALQTYGMESRHAGFWGAVKNKDICGVLYSESIEGIRFGSLCGDNDDVLKKLGQCALDHKINVLTGKKMYLAPVVENWKDSFTIEGQYDFYRVLPGTLNGRYEYPVQMASEDDVPLLVDLYKTSELGNNKNKDRKVIESEIKRTMRYETGYFFIKQNDRAACAARVVAETDKYGVLDGATTLPESRGQGMYPSVRTACLEHLFKKEKVGLGYIREDDSIMHKVVKKNGGEFIEKWLIVNRKESSNFNKKIKNKFKGFMRQFNVTKR